MLSAMTTASCEKDGDLITLSNPEIDGFIATRTNVALNPENAASNVLSLAWNSNNLTVSSSEASAPNVMRMHLQASTDKDFSSHKTEVLVENNSKTYTGAQLNTLAKDLALTANEPRSVFFRLSASIGANMEPVLSEVITINITCYEIDMSIAYVLNSNKEESGKTLYSAHSDGKYIGFIGAVGWYGYFLREGDGSLWGNDPASGIPFELSAADDSWNCWFPGQGGCYYVEFDVNKKSWTALHIPTLTASGDIAGEMTYKRAENKWSMPFSTSSTSLTLQLNGTGQQYDASTGDAAFSEKTLAFSQHDEGLALSDAASNIDISVPKAGEYTLTIDLSNPKAWTITASEGTEELDMLYPELFVMGLADADSWTFDHTMPLYDEENKSYAGVFEVTPSQWGYYFGIEKDNWEDKYTMESGDALSGKLEARGTNNITAPSAGLHLVEASLNALTYNTLGIGTQIYIAGLNDDWSNFTSLDATANAGEYAGTISVNTASTSGFQILLGYGDWNHYYGGYDGSLHYKGGNISDDANLTPGNYTLTVNLIDRAYSIKGHL